MPMEYFFILLKNYEALNDFTPVQDHGISVCLCMLSCTIVEHTENYHVPTEQKVVFQL